MHVRRLILPAITFVIFAAALLNQNDLLSRFGTSALVQAEQVVSYVLQIGIWLSAAFLVNRATYVFIWDGPLMRRLHVPVPTLIRNLGSALVYIVAISGIVGVVFDKPVTAFWATSGVISLVVGLALRNVILDLFMGIAIDVERPYKIGDFIMLPAPLNMVGRVKEINWRTTRLQTNENNTIVIPNSRMGESVLVNFSDPDPTAEFELTFTLDYAVPPDRALRVLTAGAMAVAGQDGILADPAPKARVKGTTGTGVDYKVKYVIDCSKVGPGKARHRVIVSILEQLHQAGLQLAYSKQDVFYARMPERQIEGKSVDDRIKLLSRIELFTQLEPDELEDLAVSLKPRTFGEHQALIKQGDPGESMFIVIEGLLYVFIDFDGPEGNEKEMRVAQIRAGEFLGEMSLLTGEPRTATVQAATETVVYEITKDAVERLFVKRPELVETISHIVADRKLRNTEAYEKATRAERDEQRTTLAAQIRGRITVFFHHLFDHGEVNGRNGASHDNGGQNGTAKDGAAPGAAAQNGTAPAPKAHSKVRA
jgi:small-conductance mechanosensitive channel/CRP-like cAMP-binding protein